MIASETWRRFQTHWGALALAGLYSMVFYFALGLVIALVAIPVMAATGFGIFGLAGGLGSGEGLGQLLVAAGLLFVLLALVALAGFILVVPVATGGLIHGVIGVANDRPASFGELWEAGRRHWAPLLRLNIIVAAIMIGLTVVGFILSLVPVLGTAVWACAMGLVAIVLGGYAPYLVVAEGLGARAATARAWRILSEKFVDVLLTMLVLFAFGAALLVVTYILGKIPLLGSLLNLAIEIMVAPTWLLYLIIRYRTNIAPFTGPPGGAGTFDQGPPPGP